MHHKLTGFAVGIFVSTAILLFMLITSVLTKNSIFEKKYYFTLLFAHPVTGLYKGARVNFQGVNIGEVIGIKTILYSGGEHYYDTYIQVVIMVDPRDLEFVHQAEKHKIDMYALIKEYIVHGLRAQLQFESIVTGRAQIMLDFFPGSSMSFLSRHTRYPQIPTITSNLEELQSSLAEMHLDKLSKQLIKTLTDIDSFFSSPALTQTLNVWSLNAEPTKQIANQVNKLLAGLNDNFGPNAEFATNLQQSVINFNKAAKAIQNTADVLSENPEGILYGRH